MASSLFGWDLLYKSVEADVKNNQDVLVCFTHLVLISNGFKCIGLGDSKNIDGTETKSEILPKGWNENENYAIRYVYQGRLYNLKGTNMDDAIMMNLIRVQERTVSMVQLNIRAVVQRTGSLDQMIPNSEELAQTIKKQLIDKIAVSSKYKESTSQTTSSSETVQGEVPRMPESPSAPVIDPLRVPFPRGDPLGVGRADLDPFGGFGPGPLGRPPGFPAMGGGGMIFVPPRGPRLDPLGPNLGVPPGSIPPGARFDPFRPPDVDRFHRPPNRPDNDDLPPPGFDDMYM